MLNITINDTINFQLEKTTLAMEAFAALRCFTESVLDTVPDPLVFSYAGVNGEVLVAGSQDWKPLLAILVDNNVNLTIVGMENNSDSEDDESYEIISSTIGVESVSDIEEVGTSPKPAAMVEEEESESEDQMVIEDAVEQEEPETPVVEEEPAVVEEQPLEEPKPMTGCQLVRDFLNTVGKEDLQNMIAVCYSLLQEGNNLGDAIRSAVDMSDAAASHPLMQKVLPKIDEYSAKFTPWIGPLITLDLSIVTQLVEPLILCAQRTVEHGLNEVELNLAEVCPPEVIARLQQLLPNGTERVYQVNPTQGPNEALDRAQEEIEGEFATDVHTGITCDGCDMVPIRGIRYKCTVRRDFDLCEDCEAQDTTGYAMIKIKENVGTRQLRTPGVWEFGQENKRKCGFGKNKGCGRRGGRRCGGRGGCPPFIREMKQKFFEEMKKGNANEGGCPFRQMKQKFFEEMKKNCQQFQEQAKAPSDPTLQCCPQGHPLMRFVNQFSTMTCDGCSSSHQIGDVMYGCRMCNYDKCPACFGTQPEEANEPQDCNLTDHLQEEKPRRKKCGWKKHRKNKCHKKKHMKKMWKEFCRSQEEENALPTRPFDAKVMDHLDLAEESVQAAGNIVLKTWKVKNTGTETWSEDTIVSFVKGSANLVVDSYAVVGVGSLAPGDVAYIRAMFQVPTTPGKYFITYRLFAPEQGKFGQKLRTVIIVEEQQVKPAAVIEDNDEEEEDSIESAVELVENDEEEEDSIESAVEVVEETNEPEEVEVEPFQYQAGLDQLQAIGFFAYLPEDEIKAILVAVEGSVELAVDMVLATVNNQ